MSHAGLLLLGLVLSAGANGAGDHMVAGARLFRDGHFAEALVEFRVAQRLGAPEAERYAGAALVKLDRPEEAIEAFGGVEEPGPDPLLDYYRALAAYGARLYVATDRLLAAEAGRSGPRLAELAAKLRARLAPVLARAPTKAAVDWYRARCEERRAEGRGVLAEAYCREAAELALRRPDRRSEADAAGARAESPGGRP